MELLEGIGWFRDHTLSKPTMRAKTIIREDAHLCGLASQLVLYGHGHY